MAGRMIRPDLGNENCLLLFEEQLCKQQCFCVRLPVTTSICNLTPNAEEEQSLASGGRREIQGGGAGDGVHRAPFSLLHRPTPSLNLEGELARRHLPPGHNETQCEGQA